MHRVLIANRGEMASRLIRAFGRLGLETVSVFSEADHTYPFVEAADYPVYLNGRTVPETYLDVGRIVSAAADAGCDVIHPGYCFLAQRMELVRAAFGAHLPVVAPEAELMERTANPFVVFGAARQNAIPIVPTSLGVLGAEADPLPAAAILGVPLFVKAARGGVRARVSSLDDLGRATQRVRQFAAALTGSADVYLQRVIRGVFRTCNTTVVGDRHGQMFHLATTDSSLQYDYKAWIEEGGCGLHGELHQRLGEHAVALARALGWWGVGTVRWALTDDGGAYLLGFSGRLTTGFPVWEGIHGVDLIEAQWDAFRGAPIEWTQQDCVPHRHVVQARIVHRDMSSGSRPSQEVEGLELPEAGDDLVLDVGVAEGTACSAESDPLLVKVTAIAEDRQEALARLRRALDEVRIEGVAHNLTGVTRMLGSAAMARGAYGTHSLPEELHG